MPLFNSDPRRDPLLAARHLAQQAADRDAALAREHGQDRAYLAQGQDILRPNKRTLPRVFMETFFPGVTDVHDNLQTGGRMGDAGYRAFADLAGFIPPGTFAANAGIQAARAGINPIIAAATKLGQALRPVAGMRAGSKAITTPWWGDE